MIAKQFTNKPDSVSANLSPHQIHNFPKLDSPTFSIRPSVVSNLITPFGIKSMAAKLTHLKSVFRQECFDILVTERRMIMVFH